RRREGLTVDTRATWQDTVQVSRRLLPDRRHGGTGAPRPVAQEGSARSLEADEAGAEGRLDPYRRGTFQARETCASLGLLRSGRFHHRHHLPFREEAGRWRDRQDTHPSILLLQ